MISQDSDFDRSRHSHSITSSAHGRLRGEIHVTDSGREEVEADERYATCRSHTASFFDKSIVTTRLATPTWIAASPIPGA